MSRSDNKTKGEIAMRIGVRAALAAFVGLGLAGAASAQELRITWYNDGNEGEV
ncbi:MAG: hypothetical protein JNK11_15495, partial [Alphaproteobacteria bacterium]|nr:hypothetical protein [Alphaproteobacteria bacterium]